MIDVSKIKVGDKVTYEGTVIRVHPSHDKYQLHVCFGGDEQDAEWMGESGLISHTPAPRKFKAGDKVTFTGLDRKEYTGKLVIKHDDKAIVEVWVGSEQMFMWPNYSIILHADE